MLLQKDEIKIKEIANLTSVTGSTVSQVTKALESNNIVKRERSHRNEPYKVSLNTDGLKEIVELKRKREEVDRLMDEVFK